MALLKMAMRPTGTRQKQTARWRQYEDAKQQLGKLAATCAEYEQICKAIAYWYGV